MSEEAQAFYWDTCVFIAYLNDDRLGYGDLVDHIGQFLDEAKRGECRIHCSTITIAEITRDRMLTEKYGTFSEFLQAYQSAVVGIAPDNNVMALASELRSLTYTKTSGTRKLGTADAIHLASAIALRQHYGVRLNAFHTFDNGKKNGPDGRGVPLLSFETWCEQCQNDPLARKVIDMVRCRPEHPNRTML